MFQLTFGLFLLFFVVRSVSCLKCYQTDTSKCKKGTERGALFKCLNDGQVESKQCDSDLCMASMIVDKDGHKMFLKGCGNSADCVEELYKPVLGKEIADEIAKQIAEEVANVLANKPPKLINTCQSCNSDNCNEKPLKDLRGSETTSAPKKSRGSRSHRSSIMNKTSIFVYIIVLHFLFFCKF